jgi:hypothetical protein
VSFICVGCRQVQESRDKFAPVPNHTHQIVGENDINPPEESKLQHDVREVLLKDGMDPGDITDVLKVLK